MSGLHLSFPIAFGSSAISSDARRAPRGPVNVAHLTHSTASVVGERPSVKARDTGVSFLATRNRTERRSGSRVSILHADNPAPVLCANLAAAGAALAARMAGGVA